MLTMALFTMMTADAGTAAQLLSLAVRKYAMITTVQNDPKNPVIPGERERRAFWTVKILDTAIGTRLGLPLTLVYEEYPLLVLRERFVQLKGFSPTLQAISEISIMESNIYKRLYKQKALVQSDKLLMSSLNTLSRGLECWLQTVSVDLRPNLDHPTPLSIPSLEALMIHLAYCHCVDMVHWAARRHSSKGTYPTTISMDNQRVSVFIEMSRKAARATLRVLPAFPMGPFVDVWRLLCYPVSASINLFTGVLEYPLSVSAKSDVMWIKSFCNYVAKLEEDGCQVYVMLHALLRMERLARASISEAKAISPVTDRRQLTTRQNLEHLLASCTHPMYVAQGLLTNMETRDSATTEALSEALGMGTLYKRHKRRGVFMPGCFR
ncbi:hypothetical protein GGS20DRAFT_591956 [Poronia punctata]|nr:hypothetical protein GGS20DRAFT_591956 [Poronia punctata]